MRKHNLDFEIVNTGNLKTLVFVDASDYMEQPERPLAEITPPGFTKYFLVNIVARKINTLNSNTIGITEAFSNVSLTTLPDGVWTIKYKVCPYDRVFVTKYHMRTVQLECTLQEIFRLIELSDCDSERDEKRKKEIIDIMLLIEKARAEAADGCVRKATDAYQKANSKATRILEKLNCSNC